MQQLALAHTDYQSGNHCKVRHLQGFRAKSARMDTVETPSLCWADLQPKIVVKVCAELPLMDDFTCEKVWRHVLLSSLLAGQSKADTLVLLQAVGRSQTQGETPDWVTQLQQLRRLNVPHARLRDLNVADLMLFPRVQQLNLGNPLVINWRR